MHYKLIHWMAALVYIALFVLLCASWMCWCAVLAIAGRMRR
jgi:hypothetical protein